ncbi:hypothetical protein D3C77_577620 [compost metagenome]
MTLEQRTLLLSLANKIFYHRCSRVEVGNNAILHRTDSTDIAWRSTDHLLGRFSDRYNALIICIHRNYRRFSHNNSFTSNINERIRCTQINP